MDERHARFSAGSEGDRSTHRVGLTRHCLASGLVQLPFALRNALPEGALLAHDVERDASLDLTFLPPRQLAGLAEFFATHELRVNDEIELRVAFGDAPELRLLPVRRPRADERPPAPRDGAIDVDADGDAERPRTRRTASVWRSWREDGPARPSTGAAVGPETGALPARPDEADPEVVERFGNVTVRRLGSTGVGEAPTSVLADATAAAPAPEPSDAPPQAPWADDRPERLLGIDPDHEADAAPTNTTSTDATAIDAILLDEVPTDDPLMDDAPLVQGPAEPSRATEPGPEPIEPDVDEGSAALDAGDDAAVRQASLFDAPAGERSAPAPAPRPAPARPRIGPVPDETVPRAVPDARPSGALDTAAAQRAREEALSRAGDLRSRIVRWMLAPDTPVIVSIEAVQVAFELPADVARDIVEGILESPPPSLRLTRVRADLLRVSRITVEQDA